MSRLDEIDKVNVVNPSGSDDLYICCASFEPRCNGAMNLLSPDYRVHNSFVFWYNEPDLTGSRIKHMEEIKQKLSNVSDVIQVLETPRDDPIVGIKMLKEKCSKANISLNDKNITLDITTFTKQYTLVLLKLLNDFEKGNKIRILYTEPEEYGPRRGGRLTEGLKKIVSIPFFGGRYRLDSKSILVLFLGYEGERAMAIWEEYEPEKTIAFIGKPGYREGWECVSEELNERLLNMLGVERQTIPTLDPFSVAAGLNEIRKKHENWNMYISPLGSKIQALGVYLFAKQKPEIQVVYAIPLVYLEEEYSRGIGPTRQLFLQ